jgi:acyl carrier protein
VTTTPPALDKEELRATVAGALDTEVSDVTDEANFVDDLGVDSLMALEVVVVLEKKYGVRLQESELKRISTLNNAFDVMSTKLQDG